MNKREEIENELAEFLYTGVAEFHGVENGNFPLARKILSLPSLQSTIEKAERYDKHDKVFEGLKIEENCNHPNVHLAQNIPVKLYYRFCEDCHGTGQILRELTEDEGKEVLEHLRLASCKSPAPALCDYWRSADSLELKSGAKVVRGIK